MWYTSSCGRIELEITLVQAESCTHSGDCSVDVVALRKVPKIKRQLDKIDGDVLIGELRGYGAWDIEELQNHNANLERILWLACGDIVENKK